MKSIDTTIYVLVIGITLAVISVIILAILKYPVGAGNSIILFPIIFTLYGMILSEFWRYRKNLKSVE